MGFSKSLSIIPFDDLRWDLQQLYCVLSVIVVLTASCSQGEAYSSYADFNMKETDKKLIMPSTDKLIVHLNNETSEDSFRYPNFGSLNKDFLLGRSSDLWDSTETLSSRAIGRNSLKRGKRSVIHLFNMVVCATGCNPLSYKGYGCYCGFLGSGYPVDGIDRCCWMHDRCYDATKCPTFSEYFIPYYWKCYRGHRPICAVTHGSWGGSGSCSQRLCECDRALAKCLRKFPCPSSKAVCTSSPFRLVQNIFMIF